MPVYQPLFVPQFGAGVPVTPPKNPNELYFDTSIAGRLIPYVFVVGTGWVLATDATVPIAVAALGAATAGKRSFVNNATAALTAGIGTIVAGGGVNVVPVIADGVNWRIG